MLDVFERTTIGRQYQAEKKQDHGMNLFGQHDFGIQLSAEVFCQKGSKPIVFNSTRWSGES
jgi:hypothetical protein